MDEINVDIKWVSQLFPSEETVSHYGAGVCGYHKHTKKKSSGSARSSKSIANFLTKSKWNETLILVPKAVLYR